MTTAYEAREQCPFPGHEDCAQAAGEVASYAERLTYLPHADTQDSDREAA